MAYSGITSQLESSVLKEELIEEDGELFTKVSKRLDAAAAKSLQSCPTLCNPMDSSPPGSSVHRVLQARTLEWAAISFSKRLDEGWAKILECLSPIVFSKMSANELFFKNEPSYANVFKLVISLFKKIFHLRWLFQFFFAFFM